MPSNKGTTWKLAGAKTTTDIFNYYLNNVTYNNISDKKQFKEILVDINQEFMRMVIEEGKAMRMPNLSTLSVIKFRPKKQKNIDLGKLNATGEKEYYTNEHSGGYSFRFYWKKKNCRVPGKTVYCFKAARDNSRAIAKAVKLNGHIKYSELNGI